MAASEENQNRRSVAELRKIFERKPEDQHSTNTEKSPLVIPKPKLSESQSPPPKSPPMEEEKQQQQPFTHTIRGISLSHFKNLLYTLGFTSKDARKLTFYDVCERIKSRTKNQPAEDRSYLAMLPPSEVGPAEHFVSYAWGGNVRATFEALASRFPTENPFLFIDFACLDQHKIAETNGKMTFEDLGDRFSTTLKSIGSAVVVLTPAPKPLAKDRCWCCFEWAMFRRLEIPFSYCVPEKDVQDMISELKTGDVGQKYFESVFASINVSRARASSPHDQENIIELIKQIGEVEVNNVVMDCIKEWLVKVCEKAIEDPSLQTRLPEKASVVSAFAGLLNALGNRKEAFTRLKQALEIARDLGDDNRAAICCLSLANYVTDELVSSEEAEALYSEAISIWRRLEFGRVSYGLEGLGLFLTNENRLEEGETFLREAVAIRKDGLGKQHFDVGLILGGLAKNLFRQNKLDEAIVCCQESIDILRSCGEIDNPSYGEELSLMAKMLVSKKDYDGAQRMFEEAITICERSIGRDHHLSLEVIKSYASFLEEKKQDYETAEQLYRECFELARKRENTEDHPYVGAARKDLVIFLYRQKRYDDVLTIAYEAFQHSINPDDFQNIMLKRHVGFTLKALKRGEEALEYYHDVFESLHRTLGTEDKNTLKVKKELADFTLELKKYSEAASMYRELVTIKMFIFGEDNLQVADSLIDLAFALKSMKEHAEAEQAFQEALCIREASGNLELIADSQHFLADFYFKIKWYEEGELYSQKTLETMMQSYDEIGIEIGNAWNNFGWRYNSAKMYQKALPMFEKSLAIFRELGSPPAIAIPLKNYGIALYSLGILEEAQQSFEECLAHLRESDDVGVLPLVDCLDFYGDLLRQKKQFDKAEQLLLEALSLKLEKLAENDIGVAETRLKLANLFKDQGKIEEAKEMAAQALQLAVQILPEEDEELVEYLSWTAEAF